uniref:Uncharacterized protein n=1 Tax=Plectus sambesii TaxID=2011161 RepID=A0A914WUU2_9BILA
MAQSSAGKSVNCRLSALGSKQKQRKETESLKRDMLAAWEEVHENELRPNVIDYYDADYNIFFDKHNYPHNNHFDYHYYNAYNNY